MKKKIPKKYKEDIEEYKQMKMILERKGGKDKQVDLSLAIHLGRIRNLLPQHINLCLSKITEMEEIKYTQ